MDKYVIDLDGYDDVGWGILNISIPCGIFEVIMSVVKFFSMPKLPFYVIPYVNPIPWCLLILGAIQDRQAMDRPPSGTIYLGGPLWRIQIA